MHLVRRQVRRAVPSFLIFVLVVSTLEAQSIWWDEGISLHLASLPWRDILADRAANIHPPLYFLLLKGWAALAGSTPFSGRYLSALAVTLLPVCAYRFVGRRAGWRAARVAAFLVSVAPPCVIYGQEVRAYALLPLGVLGLWSLAWPARTASGSPDGIRRRRIPHPDRARAAALGLVQAALFLTHYVGIVACAVAALAYVYRAARAPRGSSRRQVVHEWVWGALVTVILVLPWFWIVATVGLSGMARQAGLANVTAPPVAWEYVAGLLGMFHTTALPAALGDRLLTRPSALVGLLLFLGALQGLIGRQRRTALGASLFFWLTPFASAPLIWALSPQSHPRYLYAFVAGGWLTAAIVIGKRNVSRLVRGGLLAAVLMTSVLSIRAYLTLPVYARSDVRAAAAFLHDEAEPGDVVVVPHTEWSLSQYDLGQARAVMVPPYDRWDREFQGLANRLGAAQRVYVLDYARGAVDPGGAFRVALTRTGALVARHTFPGVFLEVYEMTGSIREPDWQVQDIACVPTEALCLEASAYPADPVSGAALPVAFRWRGHAPGVRYGVALRLYAPSGALIASVDDLLVDDALVPTSRWAGERVVSSYHVVPLPVGLLPVSYRLEAGVFDWDDPDRSIAFYARTGRPAPAVIVGYVVPRVAPWRDTSMYGLGGLPADVGEAVTASLRLEAAGVDRSIARPGEVIFVSTLWRLAQPSAAAIEAEVTLSRDGAPIVAVPLQVAEPGWPQGRPLLHSVALTIPASAPSGSAYVAVNVEGRTLVIGEVTLDSITHLYEAPPAAYPVTVRVGDVATLVGFDLSPGAVVVAGAPYTVTLHWRAEAGAALADLKVFTHLVVDDQIVAQHDAVPVNWSRPTPGWVTGEIVVDAHGLAWQNADIEGEGTLYVGLYHPGSGERVSWENGDDRFVLPVAISVRSSE